MGVNMNVHFGIKMFDHICKYVCKHEFQHGCNHWGMVRKCGMVLYYIIWYGMVLDGMVLYYIIWYWMVWYCIRGYGRVLEGKGWLGDGFGWYRRVWDGKGWYGMLWGDGMGWYGMVWDGMIGGW